MLGPRSRVTDRAPGSASVASPRAIVRLRADQTEAHELLPYGEREQTRSTHLAMVRRPLGFRAWDADSAAAIGEWLAERALEHERPSVLMSLLAEHLRARRVVRPSVWVLARLIGSAREAAHDVARSTRLTWRESPPARASVPYISAAPAGGVAPCGGAPTALNSRPRACAHVYG